MLEAWNKLPAEEKLHFTEGYGSDEYSNLETLEFTFGPEEDISSIKDPVLKNYAIAMYQEMENQSNLEVEDTYYPLVGPTYAYSVVILKLDGQMILGGSIGFIQYGCSNADSADEEFEHYANETEAEMAGCDLDADVSWQAWGSFDYDLSNIHMNDYMEWSGH